MQGASQDEPQPSTSWRIAAASMTGLQPEAILMRHIYRRQVLQDSAASPAAGADAAPAAPAGISSGDSNGDNSSGFKAAGNNENAGAQCSGTGNLCQNSPTTVNSYKTINVYQNLPQSTRSLCICNAFHQLLHLFLVICDH